MTGDLPRFECVVDPSNYWIVWDKFAEAPAEVSGFALLALPKEVASAACDLFNMAAELDALPRPATHPGRELALGDAVR